MKATSAPFTMKLRSAAKKRSSPMPLLPTPPTASTRKLQNRDRVRSTSPIIAPKLEPIDLPVPGNEAVEGIPDADTEMSVNPEVKASAQIMEDIIDGVLSDITESDDELSGGDSFSSKSGELTPVITGEGPPLLNMVRSALPAFLVGQTLSALITPQNSFDGPPSAAPRAPRKSRNPRRPRSASTPTRPKIARRSTSRRHSSLDIITNSDGATPSIQSFHLGMMVPPIPGASRSDPDSIFRRELMNLENERRAINAALLWIIHEDATKSTIPETLVSGF